VFGRLEQKLTRARNDTTLEDRLWPFNPIQERKILLEREDDRVLGDLVGDHGQTRRLEGLDEAEGLEESVRNGPGEELHAVLFWRECQVIDKDQTTSGKSSV
jgi:hypothetical protein